MRVLRVFLLVAVCALSVVSAYAQQAGGVSAEQVSKANNPLADLSAFNLQNYYVPSVYGVPDASANTMFLRGVYVSGRHIVRATLPISTAPVGAGAYRSGFGDFNIFDSIKLTGPGATTEFAVGPLLVIPTGTDSALSSRKWQLGAAAIAIHPLPGGSLLGALVTYQHSIFGDNDKPAVNFASFQPFVTFSIGGGYYVKSTAIWTFDIKGDNYLIPFGIGFGKVFPCGPAICNAAVEPQFSIYHKGVGLPSVQIAAGLNMQFPR